MENIEKTLLVLAKTCHLLDSVSSDELDLPAKARLKAGKRSLERLIETLGGRIDLKNSKVMNPTEFCSICYEPHPAHVVQFKDIKIYHCCNCSDDLLKVLAKEIEFSSVYEPAEGLRQ